MKFSETSHAAGLETGDNGSFGVVDRFL